MDVWVRFNAQSQSKDRLFRAAQYACMLLGYTLHKSRAASDLLKTLSDLEKHLSLTRKFLRLGNSVEALEAAKRAIHLSDGVLRLCLTISHLNKAMYFACDNVVWAGKTGLFSKVDQQKWSQRSFRYYLFALLVSLTRDLYELSLLMDNEARYQSAKTSASANSSHDPPADCLSSLATSSRPPLVWSWLLRHFRQVVTVLQNNPPLLLDLLKNSCDIFIPLDRLGIYPTGPGFVGACGVASSVLAILAVTHPWLKLKP
ncbi:Peroxisomal membrane protein 11B [Oryzias melastigma]|uniref:Peroxisomal membrane protein 11B n=1 Tax=Oryzias melastigma TaxID=30732 RepID=A0A834FP59_ORYME|nr:Peroxisomal membrane protein 11B [Oryzias melastigma]